MFEHEERENWKRLLAIGSIMHMFHMFDIKDFESGDKSFIKTRQGLIAAKLSFKMLTMWKNWQ